MNKETITRCADIIRKPERNYDELLFVIEQYIFMKKGLIVKIAAAEHGKPVGPLGASMAMAEIELANIAFNVAAPHIMRIYTSQFDQK